MTPDDENRAAEARRLEDNETLQMALWALRSAALENLAEADPLDQGAITSMIFAGAAQKHRPVA